jgi:hypothetical protein
MTNTTNNPKGIDMDKLLLALRPFAAAFEQIKDGSTDPDADIQQFLDGNTVTPKVTMGDFRRAYEAVAEARRATPAPEAVVTSQDRAHVPARDGELAEGDRVRTLDVRWSEGENYANKVGVIEKLGPDGMAHSVAVRFDDGEGVVCLYEQLTKLASPAATTASASGEDVLTKLWIRLEWMLDDDKFKNVESMLQAIRAQISSPAPSHWASVSAFLEQLSECSGGMVNGNRLARSAKELLACDLAPSRETDAVLPQDERQAFESYMGRCDFQRFADGSYVDGGINKAWGGWQARAALATSGAQPASEKGEQV